MKHNLKGIFRLTEARTFWVRAVRAWRELLPDWRPTLDALRALEEMPREHVAAVRIVSHEWDNNDPRWDVLMALFEWHRRDAVKAHESAKEAAFMAKIREFEDRALAEGVEPSMFSEEHERLREDNETTVETPLPKPQLVLVPKIPPRVFTIRTLASLRAEQQGEGV